MTLALRSPFADPEFGLEKSGAQKEVQFWWPLFMDVVTAPNTVAALESVAVQIGQPFGTVKRKYYEWKGEQFDWKVLINRSKFPARRVSALPVAFIQYWKELNLANQRDNSGKGTYELLLAQLELWEADPFNPEKAIPGYIRPPKRSAKSRHPAGWSYETLMRRLSDKYTKTLKKQGPKAASEYLPNIPTTRVGLAIGEYYYFDDSLHDTHVNLSGVNTKEVRALSFNCAEGLSGSLCELLLKPQIEGPNGRLELNQLDFFWFVMHVLLRHGYNAKTGTTLVVEWRTANFDKDSEFDRKINEMTGGMVRVDRSGRFGKPVFKDMIFGGQSSGNFRFKAPIESFFNLVRNRSGFLPAPTGLNPDMAPEENHGLLQENARLLRMVDKVPAAIFNRLQRPVLEWEDYALASRIIHDWIDLRTNHKLQGWDKLGFKTHRYRLSPDTEHWIGEREYLMLPAEQRAVLDHLVCKPGCYESTNLSPRSVFEGHKNQLTKLPLSAVPVLAPDRAWMPITVSQSFEMTINDPFIDSEPLVYWGTLTNSHGDEVHLKRGQKYLRLLNPFNPDIMWVAHLEGSRKGQVIGLATRVHASGKTDSDALIAMMAEHNHIKANHSREAVVQMQSEAERRVEMREHNKAVLGHLPTTEKERTRARVLKNAGRRKVDEDRVISAISNPEPASDEPRFSEDQLNNLFSNQ